MWDNGIINESNKSELKKTFPKTKDLKFVQLDEFFPIRSSQPNSFLNYVRQYYMTTLELKEENVLTMDFSTLPIFQEHDMLKVFPDYKCDLSLLNAKPQNETEKLQQTALRQVEQFCEKYDSKVRSWGGYGYFLGGIGHDGHIAFNFRGCDPSLGTRLVCLNYETAAQSASDFGGITYTRNKCAVTVGLSTIVYNPNVKVVIIAAGESKAPQVRDAIMLKPDQQRPASILQRVPGARFYLTQGSSLHLTDRRTEDVVLACRDLEAPVDSSLLFEVVINLALHVRKPVSQLTVQDFISQPIAKAVYIYWTSQSKPITKLTRSVHDYLVDIIEKGVSPPVGQRILHTGPHHDDIMLAYHEITPFLIQNNENWFAYVTSGFNSVTGMLFFFL
ncbi:glucosamine-6-phosphate deaminase [Reticulomyxa filosa]|uniref:Glucosamine-6-phosphate deaminase n=1 Tax=Reticulomyxa filosa TaxID=46433 RepID=X6NVT2_RETFI|nr:glucosamine-6-phosphate deaminase [Reticulomyxa filosa]|eukprot:ETO29929.1 glucosamine-6-phosphate deaminase [Reticulomyxa filosa]